MLEIEEPEILPHIIYFNDDHSKSQHCTSEISQLIKCTYSLPSTWRELSGELEKHDKFLIFHADMMRRSVHSTSIEFIDAIQTMVKFMPRATDLKLGVIVGKNTPLRIVKEVQKTPVQGLLLDINDYPIDQVATAINALTNKIPYWPKEVLKELPGATKPVKSKNNFVLTHRQRQVLTLIKERGASNKAIAKTLGISESTVKLHVTEIFKKYGVRNRTQLAVFSTV